MSGAVDSVGEGLVPGERARRGGETQDAGRRAAPVTGEDGKGQSADAVQPKENEGCSEGAPVCDDGESVSPQS
jgi:hypothetical protein